MHPTSFTATVILVFALVAAASPVSASPITIDEFEFDLTQFDDAYVTVSDGVTDTDVRGSDFDNNFGIDPDESDGPTGFELGELAGRNRGDGKHGAFVADNGDEQDVGDRITLDGLNEPENGPKEAKSLTLHYGNRPAPLNIYSDFVVYEQSSHPDEDGFIEEVDDEGKTFEIRFAFQDNDTTDWFQADPDSHPGNSPVTLSRVFDQADPGSTQNQIVFSLTALDLGDSRSVRSVEISNLLNGPAGDNDPDFLFAGFATRSVPLPSSVMLLLSGLVVGSLFGAWRSGFWANLARIRADA